MISAAQLRRVSKPKLVQTLIETDRICKSASGHGICYEKATGEIGSKVHALLMELGIEPMIFDATVKEKHPVRNQNGEIV